MKSKKEKTFNAFDVIGESFTSLRRKRTKAFLGSVFMLAINALVFGIIYGLANSLTVAAVAVAGVYGIMLIPYINFMCNVAEGRGALEDMFQKNQYSLSNILIGFVFAALVLFGTVLFVVPAFVFATLFILVLPIASNTTSRCFDAFIKAKELSKGFRGRILSVLLIYFVLFALVVGAAIGLSALILLLIFKFTFWWVVGAIIGVIAYLIFFMPYFILSVVYLYDNTIAEKKERSSSNGGFTTTSYVPSEKEEKEEDNSAQSVKAIESNSDNNNKNPFDYSDIIRY